MLIDMQAINNLVGDGVAPNNAKKLMYQKVNIVPNNDNDYISDSHEDEQGPISPPQDNYAGDEELEEWEVYDESEKKQIKRGIDLTKESPLSERGSIFEGSFIDDGTDSGEESTPKRRCRRLDFSDGDSEH